MLNNCSFLHVLRQFRCALDRLSLTSFLLVFSNNDLYTFDKNDSSCGDEVFGAVQLEFLRGGFPKDVSFTS